MKFLLKFNVSLKFAHIYCILILSTYSCTLKYSESELKSFNNTEAILRDSLAQIQNSLYATEDIILYTYLNSDLNINIGENNLRLYDINKKLISLDSLKNNLYISIPNNLCSSCLKDLSHIIENNNYGINCTYLIPFDFDNLSFLNETQIPISKLLYKKGNFGIPIESEDVIFMFTLSPDNIVQNIFIPQKELSELTETYLFSISSKREGNFKLRNNNHQ